MTDSFSTPGYTEPINLLDYTVIVIPVTTVDRHVDPKLEDFVPLNADDALNMENCQLSPSFLQNCERARTLMGVDDPELYHGTPVAVQIMCRKYEEEKCWAIAKIVADAVKGNPDAMF